MYVCFERRTRIPKMWALFSSLFCKEESVRKVCLDFGLSFDATTTGQGVTNDFPNTCFTLLHQLRKNQSTIISTKSAPVITPDTKDHNSLFFGYRHLNRLKFLHGTKLGEIRREKVVIFSLTSIRRAHSFHWQCTLQLMWKNWSLFFTFLLFSL